MLIIIIIIIHFCSDYEIYYHNNYCLCLHYEVWGIICSTLLCMPSCKQTCVIVFTNMSVSLTKT